MLSTKEGSEWLVLQDAIQERRETEPGCSVAYHKMIPKTSPLDFDLEVTSHVVFQPKGGSLQVDGSADSSATSLQGLIVRAVGL